MVGPELTMRELMPLRPTRIVWVDDEYSCEWCGEELKNSWAIAAAPIPEFFCSALCVVRDTAKCWEPDETCVVPDWLSREG